MKKNRIAIYTAVFGQKDELREPKFIPEGCDFICFTDQPFSSRVWEIRKVEPPVPGDMTRSNRYYKILAHKVLPEYDVSIYIDGNVQVVGDLRELISQYLAKVNFALFDHGCWKEVSLHSLKEGLGRLLQMEQEGKHQENADLMERQYNAYLAAGFPDDNGLAWTMVLVRKHHAPDVVQTMEAWWKELTTWSKRDQMSFNYVAWKEKFAFAYIPLDGSLNQYVRRMNHYLSPKRKFQSYLYGIAKRVRGLFAFAWQK